jgi:hypothetical protein
MKKHLRGAIAAIAATAAVVMGGFLIVAMPRGAAQSASSTVPRTADGKPDLTGIWQALNTAYWDLEDHPAAAGLPQAGAIGAIPPGKGVVDGNDIPYQPSAAAKRKENFKKRLTDDPEAKCYLPGVPRATYLPYPFQIVQGPKQLMFVYGYAEANRTIHLNKAQPIPAPIDSWMGRSHGRWDGDTLVVEAAGFNGQAWFDRSGNFASDALKVTERYTRTGPDHIAYEATIEDPTVFTRSWKISMPLYRRVEKNAEVVPFKCVEFAEELLYGHLQRKTGN